MGNTQNNVHAKTAKIINAKYAKSISAFFAILLRTLREIHNMLLFISLVQLNSYINLSKEGPNTNYLNESEYLDINPLMVC